MSIKVWLRRVTEGEEVQVEIPDTCPGCNRDLRRQDGLKLTMLIPAEINARLDGKRTNKLEDNERITDIGNIIMRDPTEDDDAAGPVYWWDSAYFHIDHAGLECAACGHDFRPKAFRSRIVNYRNVTNINVASNVKGTGTPSAATKPKGHYATLREKTKTPPLVPGEVLSSLMDFLGDVRGDIMVSPKLAQRAALVSRQVAEIAEDLDIPIT